MTSPAAADGPARAERRIALSYAPAAARSGLKALLALDARLAAIVRNARDPLVGQMRLTWWHEALSALDAAPPPAEPLLRALHSDALPFGVTGAQLAMSINGWERLLDPDPLDANAMADYASERGGTLFAAGAALCGAAAEQARIGGEGWALADLSRHLTRADEVARARDLAVERFDAAFRTPWPRPARALGALALLARFDMTKGAPPPAAPRRVLRLLRHRLNGT